MGSNTSLSCLMNCKAMVYKNNQANEMWHEHWDCSVLTSSVAKVTDIEPHILWKLDSYLTVEF